MVTYVIVIKLVILLLMMNVVMILDRLDVLVSLNDQYCTSSSYQLQYCFILLTERRGVDTLSVGGGMALPRSC